MSETTDVSHLFFVCYFAGLLLNALQATWSVVCCFLAKTNNTFLNAIQGVLYVSNVVYLCFVTGVRYSHAGKVCSGDYLFYPVSLQTRADGVLGIEGQFLTIFIIVNWIQMAVLLVFLITFFCCKRAKYSPDKERDI